MLVRLLYKTYTPRKSLLWDIWVFKGIGLEGWGWVQQAFFTISRVVITFWGVMGGPRLGVCWWRRVIRLAGSLAGLAGMLDLSVWSWNLRYRNWQFAWRLLSIVWHITGDDEAGLVSWSLIMSGLKEICCSTLIPFLSDHVGRGAERIILELVLLISNHFAGRLDQLF